MELKACSDSLDVQRVAKQQQLAQLQGALRQCAMAQVPPSAKSEEAYLQQQLATMEEATKAELQYQHALTLMKKRCRLCAACRALSRQRVLRAVLAARAACCRAVKNRCLFLSSCGPGQQRRTRNSTST